METIIPFSNLNLTQSDVFDAMGYNNAEPDFATLHLVEEMLERTARIVKPRFYYCIAECEILPDKVKINDILFNTGKIIAHSLRHSCKIALFVATAGMEYETLAKVVREEKDCAKHFILDSIGTCIAECAGDCLEKHLQHEIGTLKHTNRFSPGYCGWDVAEQRKLFALLPNEVCHIKLTDSCLMYPIKSISGCIGIGTEVHTNMYRCGICELNTCFRRRKTSGTNLSL